MHQGNLRAVATAARCRTAAQCRWQIDAQTAGSGRLRLTGQCGGAGKKICFAESYR